MKQFIKLTLIGTAILIGIVAGLMLGYKVTRYIAQRAVDGAVNSIEIRTCYDLKEWSRQSNLCQPNQETIDMCKGHNIIIK